MADRRQSIRSVRSTHSIPEISQELYDLDHRRPSMAVISEPASQPGYCVPKQTYVAEAVARDHATGIERRATILIDAPVGSSVRVAAPQDPSTKGLSGLGTSQRSLPGGAGGGAGAGTAGGPPGRNMTRGQSMLDDNLPRNYNTGKELETKITSLGVGKAKNPVDKVLFLGLLAGVWVSFAGLYAQQVVGAVPVAARAAWPVLPKLLIGITFPIGIVFIVLFGGELFTGNTMIMMIALLNKKVTIWALLLNWFLVFISNFVACVFVAWLFGFVTDIFADEPYRSYVIAVATRKANLSFGHALLLAIPANALVCLSVFLGLAARDITGKIVGLFLPIMTFAATGWEHVVANMYFIPIGWMYGAKVTAGLFARNLCAVAIGNIIGGGILVGMTEYYMYHWHRFKEPELHLGRWGKYPKFELFEKREVIQIPEQNVSVEDIRHTVALDMPETGRGNEAGSPQMHENYRVMDEVEKDGKKS
ncbi:Formate/nitrite transporter-domain-containing protein [Gaertneriomyces semiglobifer]|nr:Formate/nitrite transporter-domain-containing protein [Gaertneriomyces semiglobifer]